MFSGIRATIGAAALALSAPFTLPAQATFNIITMEQEGANVVAAPD
jgi:hypothetical protein